MLLDSFDGRLRAAGLRAERPRRTRRAARAARGRRAGAPGGAWRAAKRHLAHELPPGRGARAARARARGARAAAGGAGAQHRCARWRSSTARASRSCGWRSSTPELIGAGGARVALAPRLSVRPVLGYDRAFERTLATLRDELGLEPASAAALRRGGRGGRRRAPAAWRRRSSAELGARDAHRRRGRARAARGCPRSRRPTSRATIDDLDPEFLHDLRVSIRRARSVLRELKGVHEPDARAHAARRAEVGAGADRPGARPRRAAARVAGAGRRASATSARPSSSRCARCSSAAASASGPSSRAGCAARASPPRCAPGGRWRREPARRRGRTPRAAGRSRRPPASGSRRCYAPDGRATAARSTTTARPRRCTTCASAARSCATCSSCSAARSRATRSSRRSRRSRTCRRCSAASRTARCRSRRCATLRDELAAEPDGPAALIALGPVLDALRADQAAAREEFADALRGVRGRTPPGRASAFGKAFGGEDRSRPTRSRAGWGRPPRPSTSARSPPATGLRTVVWDLDPQGAATFLFRIKPKVKGGGGG